MDNELSKITAFVHQARSYGLYRNHPTDADAVRWLDEALGPGGIGEDLKRAGLDLDRPSDRGLLLALDGATGFSFDTTTMREPRDYATLIEVFGEMAEGRADYSDVEIRENEDTEAPEIGFKVDGQAFELIPPPVGKPFNREDFLAAVTRGLAASNVPERFHVLVPAGDNGSLTVLFARPEEFQRMRADGFVPG